MLARKVNLTDSRSSRDACTQRARAITSRVASETTSRELCSLNQQRRAQAIGKVMPDYSHGATSVRCDLVEPIVGLTRPTEVTVALMIQAAACRRANNQFSLRALPVLLTGRFRLSRFHQCQDDKLRKR